MVLADQNFKEENYQKEAPKTTQLWVTSFVNTFIYCVQIIIFISCDCLLQERKTEKTPTLFVFVLLKIDIQVYSIYLALSLSLSPINNTLYLTLFKYPNEMLDFITF